VFESKVLGVWVPAFAGTTQEGSNFQTTTKTQLRDLAADFARALNHASRSASTDFCNKIYQKRTHAPQQTASPSANILTAQEQACFASSAAQKRPINDHFAVIFEKPRVAVQAQNFCFKSPILRPL
jgi:hypothetical protein